MNTNNKLKERRLELGLTLEEVGNIVGVGKSTVRKWETGAIENMKRDKIALLAKALKVSPAFIMDWEKDFDIEIKPQKKGVRIPVLGYVAAGVPIEAIEDIIDWEEIPEDMAIRGKYFGLSIKGHSMEPRICPGDVVIVRQQPDIENGELAIVLINGDEATCKKVIKHKDGINLVSFNPSYEPMFYTKEEVINLPVIILGKVVELRGKF